MSEGPAATDWRRETKRAALLLGLAVMLGLGTNALSARPIALTDPRGPGALPERAPRIDAARLREALPQGGVLLLDARSERLLAEGKVAGGFAVTPETLDEKLESLFPFLSGARLMVVVCDSGDCLSGDRLAAALDSRGFPDAQVFEGGWPAYRAAGLPIEAP
ncbi:MAG: hypothetical protein AMXMBFR7_24870 [Planctomycetota bacterium]